MHLGRCGEVRFGKMQLVLIESSNTSRRSSSVPKSFKGSESYQGHCVALVPLPVQYLVAGWYAEACHSAHDRTLDAMLSYDKEVVCKHLRLPTMHCLTVLFGGLGLILLSRQIENHCEQYLYVEQIQQLASAH